MNIEQQLETLLSLSGENEVVEFKTASNHYESSKLGRYFSALSNEANLKKLRYAWLVFGVNNAHKVVGSNYHNHRPALDKLKEKIANKTTNRITFVEIHEVNHSLGRVILFQIPPAPKGIPVAWAGHYYGREGEQLNALSLEELERIRKQGIENDWSIETCKHAAITDLSKQAILKASQNEVVICALPSEYAKERILKGLRQRYPKIIFLVQVGSQAEHMILFSSIGGKPLNPPLNSYKYNELRDLKHGLSIAMDTRFIGG